MTQPLPTQQVELCIDIDATSSSLDGQEAKGADIRASSVRVFLTKHWLPISFAVSIFLALAWPVPGAYLSRIVVAGDIPVVQEAIMALVFFISGLTLDTQELKKAKAHVLGVLYGLCAILFLTPCWGFVIRCIPLQPKLLTIGLVIYCLVPASLGTGVAVSHNCKGNDGVAKMLTIISNTLGVGTMPVLLKFLFINYDHSEFSVQVKLLNLFAKLSVTILVPSVTGKLIRELSGPLKAFATRNRNNLSTVSTTAMAVVTWQVLSSARDRLFQLPLASTFSMIAITISILIFYVIFNCTVILWGFRGMPLPEAVAIIAMSSQKSAPVAVTLISYTTSDPVEQGLLSIPAIVGQLSQIMLGSILAPYVARRVDQWQAAQDTAESNSLDGTLKSAPAEEQHRRADH